MSDKKVFSFERGKDKLFAQRTFTRRGVIGARGVELEDFEIAKLDDDDIAVLAAQGIIDTTPPPEEDKAPAKRRRRGVQSIEPAVPAKSAEVVAAVTAAAGEVENK